ncbi:MAG: hypothetical protein QW555_07870 [Nitrososphaerota archaeon]
MVRTGWKTALAPPVYEEEARRAMASMLNTREQGYTATHVATATGGSSVPVPQVSMRGVRRTNVDVVVTPTTNAASGTVTITDANNNVVAQFTFVNIIAGQPIVVNAGATATIKGSVKVSTNFSSSVGTNVSMAGSHLTHYYWE